MSIDLWAENKMIVDNPVLQAGRFATKKNGDIAKDGLCHSSCLGSKVSYIKTDQRFNMFS